MSHAGQTLHYQLPQYSGTDIINPLVDTNDAYSKIDTALYEIGQGAADATATANEVKEQIEGSGGVDDRIDAAVVRLDAVEAKDVEQDASLLQLNTGLATTNANVSTLSGNVNTLDSTVANHTTAIGQLTTRVGACENADTALDARVTALENAPSPSAPTASDVSFDPTGTDLVATNVQDGMVELDTEIHSAKTEFQSYIGELQTTTLTAGATSASVNFDEDIVATTIITPVCSDYGISPTAVTYTTNSMTFTFEALDHDVTVGARIQNIIHA